MDEVLFQCRARGTTREDYRVRISLNWVFCWWTDLILTDTKLVFGSWSIPYEDIEDAAIVSVSSWGVAWVGTVQQGRLIVATREHVYQFLLPFKSAWEWAPVIDPYWGGPLPFPVRRISQAISRRPVDLFFIGILGVWLIAELLISVLR